MVTTVGVNRACGGGEEGSGETPGSIDPSMSRLLHKVHVVLTGDDAYMQDPRRARTCCCTGPTASERAHIAEYTRRSMLLGERVHGGKDGRA